MWTYHVSCMCCWGWNGPLWCQASSLSTEMYLRPENRVKSGQSELMLQLHCVQPLGQLFQVTKSLSSHQWSRKSNSPNNSETILWAVAHNTQRTTQCFEIKLHVGKVPPTTHVSLKCWVCTAERTWMFRKRVLCEVLRSLPFEGTRHQSHPHLSAS